MTFTCNRYCIKDPDRVGSLHDSHLTYNDYKGCRTCTCFWPKKLLYCPCCHAKLSTRPSAGIRRKKYQEKEKYI